VYLNAQRVNTSTKKYNDVAMDCPHYILIDLLL